MSIKNQVLKTGHRKEHLPVRHLEAIPYRSLQREMSREFNDFFTELPLVPHWGLTELAPTAFRPQVDVSETGKEVRVSAALPGLDERDITVEVDDEVISIRGEKKEEREDKGRNWYTREQAYGSFHRLIPLPASVVSEKAYASFKKGLLTITVPKREVGQSQRKTLKIETE